MRVLHYRQTFSKLSETFIYDYLSELERQGISNDVVTHERKHADARPFPNVVDVGWPHRWYPLHLMHRLLVRIGIKRARMTGWPGMGKDRQREVRRRLLSATQDVQPDVIHAHFGREGVVIAPIAERLGVPLVVTFYGFDISSLPKTDFWAEAYLELWEQAGAVTVLSEEMRQKARHLGCPDTKLSVVHLSRELEQLPFRLPSGTVRNVLFVGRLTPKKAPLDAVRSVERANRDGADLELDIVGEGPCRQKIDRYIEKQDLTDSVTLHGAVPNEEVIRRMQTSDAFLLPSKTAPDGDREGTPTVLVEAQSVGLPCVSTRHAGIPEMIPEANHEFLVEEGDVEGLSKVLCKLSHLEIEELTTIVRRGRDKVEQDYSLTGEVRKLRSIYRNL